MTFDEWWATKDLEKAQVPQILKNALKDLAYEAWCESRYQHILPEENMILRKLLWLNHGH